jgi:hypothetical protein
MHDSFRTVFLHFDSASARFITDVNNTTTVTSNPYKAQFTMNQVFTNIKRVYLKSLECPVGFSNVRTGSTNVFSFVLNGTTYNVTLPEKNYTSIATLLTDLTTACVGVVSGVIMTFSLTSSLTITNRLRITFTGGTTTSSFSVIDTSKLSKYILGFRASKDVLTGGVYAASFSNYNLNPDNYISMYIPSLNGMNSSMSGQQATFKVPLNTVTNQVYFYQENSSFTQWVDITDRNLMLSALTVNIYDKYGKDLQPNGLDYSFTLSLEIWN